MLGARIDVVCSVPQGQWVKHLFDLLSTLQDYYKGIQSSDVQHGTQSNYQWKVSISVFMLFTGAVETIVSVDALSWGLVKKSCESMPYM